MAVEPAPRVIEAVTVVAVKVPVLQTRAPTGKVLGPTDVLFESSPMTFQVSGEITSTGWAATQELQESKHSNKIARIRDAKSTRMLKKARIDFDNLVVMKTSLRAKSLQSQWLTVSSCL